MEHSGLVCMLRDNKLEELQLMYRLLSCAEGGSELILDTLSSFVRQTGKSIVQDQRY